MQKNQRSVILVLSLVYSILFYEQNAGLNFLVFTLILVACYFLAYPALLKNRISLLSGAASILSASMIVVAPCDLAIAANIVSLLLLSATQEAKGRSVMIHLINAGISVAGSFVFFAQATTDYIKQKNTENGKNQKFLVYVVTILLIVIFISIYKNINPLFEKYTKLLLLDFFGLKWSAFTIAGFFLVYGFVQHNRVPGSNEWEMEQERPLETLGPKLFDTTKKQAFTFLFTVLNLLLIFITLLDVNYLYLGAGLPDGITHKQFVHHGVGMLIFSILLGIVIILYVFRGDLNFDKNNRGLKYLAFLWIILNLFMVLSTAMRNNLYIQEALLTYKRIGVYYWLVLAATGLIATIIKIAKIKRAWYLLRSTSLVSYLLLVASCPVDWDQYISNFNLSRIKDIAALDKKYLIDLSEGNLKQLYSIKYHPKFEIDSVYHYNYYQHSSNRNDLDRKLFYFLEDKQDKGWRSFNFRADRVMQDVKTLNEQGRLDTLDLRLVKLNANLDCLQPITNLKGLKFSYLNNSTPKFIGDINRFKNLRMLQFSNAAASDSVFIKHFKNIQLLRLRANSKEDSIILSKVKVPYELVLFR